MDTDFGPSREGVLAGCGAAATTSGRAGAPRVLACIGRALAAGRAGALGCGAAATSSGRAGALRALGLGVATTVCSLGRPVWLFGWVEAGGEFGKSRLVSSRVLADAAAAGASSWALRRSVFLSRLSVFGSAASMTKLLRPARLLAVWSALTG